MEATSVVLMLGMQPSARRRYGMPDALSVGSLSLMSTQRYWKNALIDVNWLVLKPGC